MLPVPDAAALASSDALLTGIARQIGRADGCLSFAEYMQAALYSPGLGYYVGGAQKFGSGGDFVTAPELSPLFGECLAGEISAILPHVGPAVLELGAGSGRLAADLITHLEPGIDYLILEPGAELRARQQAHLATVLDAQSLARVRWLDRLPEDFAGVVVANEVLDALPVERVVRRAHWRRCGVACQRDGGELRLHWCEHDADAALLQALEHVESDIGQRLPDGYTTEICAVLPAWLASLADAMTRGVALFIDYGYPRREYYSAERTGGTLSCHFRHHRHDDPFLYPGLQDLTAHVDFTAVAEAGAAAGLELLGYTSQSAWLLALGLPERASRALQAQDRDLDRIAVNQAVGRLTLPGEMGERFQVMALGKAYDRPLRGFSGVELSHRL